MKCALAGLFCALVSVSLAYAQEASRRTPAREQIGSGRQITLDVLIADLSEAVEKPTATKLLEMEKGGKLVAATRLQMAMLDELPSFIQFGGGRFASRSVPAGPRGGSSGTATGGRGFSGAQPVGNIIVSGQTEPPQTSVRLQATARIEDDGMVLMQVFLERPESAVPQKILGADASDEARRNFAFISQGTVKMKHGEPKLLSGRQSAVGIEGSQTWIVATATVEAGTTSSK